MKAKILKTIMKKMYFKKILCSFSECDAIGEKKKGAQSSVRFALSYRKENWGPDLP